MANRGLDTSIELVLVYSESMVIKKFHTLDGSFSTFPHFSLLLSVEFRVAQIIRIKPKSQNGLLVQLSNRKGYDLIKCIYAWALNTWAMQRMCYYFKWQALMAGTNIQLYMCALFHSFFKMLL